MDQKITGREGTLRTIVVDDEQLSLQRFLKLLKEIDCLNILGGFTNPKEALQNILAEKPDIVFLDIEMPELSGIDITEIIEKTNKDIQIVFVTAYQDYAVKAFDLNVVDYLTKPIQRERLERTISRIKQRHKQKKVSLERYPEIICFDSLQFKWSDEETFLKASWRTKKTKELFSYLLFHKDREVRKDLLVDMLWPHLQWKQGISLLYSAIYQVRRTLRSIKYDNYIEIKNSENYYLLKTKGIKIDFIEWENKIDQLEGINERNLSEYEEVIMMYSGDFLNKNEYDWSEVERKRLRTTWLYLVRKTVDFLIENAQFLKAINIYHYVQEVYPSGEDSYFALMKLYHEINNRDAVMTQYNTLNQVLMQDLGVEPQSEIQEWYEKWESVHV